MLSTGESAESATEPLVAAVADLLDRPLAPLSDDEVVTVMRDVETCVRRLATLQHRLLIEAEERSMPARAGVKTGKRFLMDTLRLSSADAGRRVNIARWVGQFHDLTGEARDPQLPCTADGLTSGVISTDHVRGIAQVMNRLPYAVSTTDHEAAEHILAEFARTGSPDDIGKIGDRILAHLDPDGRLSNDADRARMRGLIVGRQRADGMSAVRGEIDPVLRALLDPLLAKYARPGVCNPDDPSSPATDIDGADPAVLDAAARADHRSPAQRNHDALAAVLGSGLVAEDLGRHRGMPVATILTIKLDDLDTDDDGNVSGATTGSAAGSIGSEVPVGEALASGTATIATGSEVPIGEAVVSGSATTATGGRVPMADALKLAERSRPYLAVFDHAGLPLHLGRMKRLASPAQRLALIAALRGCSRPGCDAPASLCAVHHVQAYAQGGPTDINNLVLACDACHALIHDGPGGWRTVTNDPGSPFPGRTAWIAPAHIDPTRTPTVNHRHHADELLATIVAGIHDHNERDRQQRRHDNERHRQWLRSRPRPPDNNAA